MPLLLVVDTERKGALRGLNAVLTGILLLSLRN